MERTAADLERGVDRPELGADVAKGLIALLEPVLLATQLLLRLLIHCGDFADESAPIETRR